MRTRMVRVHSCGVLCLTGFCLFSCRLPPEHDLQPTDDALVPRGEPGAPLIIGAGGSFAAGGSSQGAGSGVASRGA